MHVSQRPSDDGQLRELGILGETMRGLSAQEAMDQVYREVIIHLCSACYRQWIENSTAL